MTWVDLAVFVAGQLVTAGAVYGGIRSDLKHALHEARRANKRIDHLLAKGISS